MTVHGMNRWKSAKASEFTLEGSGQVRTTDEGGDGPIKKMFPEGGDSDGPIKKIYSASQTPEDDTMAAAMGLSTLLRPQGGDADGPIKKSLRVRGTERLQAVRPDENPGPDQNDQDEPRDACAVRSQGRPRRRRRRRTTRSLGRSSSTP